MYFLRVKACSQWKPLNIYKRGDISKPQDYCKGRAVKSFPQSREHFFYSTKKIKKFPHTTWNFQSKIYKSQQVGALYYAILLCNIWDTAFSFSWNIKWGLHLICKVFLFNIHQEIGTKDEDKYTPLLSAILCAQTNNCNTKGELLKASIFTRVFYRFLTVLGKQGKLKTLSHKPLRSVFASISYSFRKTRIGKKKSEIFCWWGCWFVIILRKGYFFTLKLKQNNSCNKRSITINNK